MTKILPCKCSHAYQDEKYGKDKRLHNRVAPKSKGMPSWRCTVCVAEREAA